MKTTINIHKKAGQKKDAIRITVETDIPEFLRETVKVEEGQIKLICVEGNENAPIGSVIGYEKTSSTETGWNAWHIANADTNLVEVDGNFYKKATIKMIK